MHYPMSLHIVGRGHALHDPKAKGPNRIWLLEGQTLDLGDPWVVEEIRGQEYKLEPAPAGASETPKEAWPGALLNRWRASSQRTVVRLPIRPRTSANGIRRPPFMRDPHQSSTAA